MSTKRARRLDWIRNRDRNDVPVLMGLHSFETGAAWVGKDQHDVTRAEAIRTNNETGTHLVADLVTPVPRHAIPFVSEIEMSESSELLPDSTRRERMIIEMPEDALRYSDGRDTNAGTTV